MFTNQKLKQLIVPLVIEQILAVLVGMADIMMVSSVSEAAVSGVSLVDSLSLIHIFSLMLNWICYLFLMTSLNLLILSVCHSAAEGIIALAGYLLLPMTILNNLSDCLLYTSRCV